MPMEMKQNVVMWLPMKKKAVMLEMKEAAVVQMNRKKTAMILGITEECFQRSASSGLFRS